MKSADTWTPSKFIIKNDKLIASRSSEHVSISSRFSADIVADLYWTHLSQHCRGRLLDLGCGEVPLYEAYRNLIDENICVDWANTAHKNIHLDYECDLTKDLPFHDGSFDTIILSSVLEHIPEPAKVWQEMSRVLKPGGKILLNVPFYYWLHEIPHDFYRYTEFALKRFANITNFEILILEKTGGVPEILADILAKNLMRLRIVGKPSAVLIQYVAQIFLKTRLGKKLSASTAEQFPLGYFMVVQKR